MLINPYTQYRYKKTACEYVRAGHTNQLSVAKSRLLPATVTQQYPVCMASVKDSRHVY